VPSFLKKISAVATGVALLSVGMIAVQPAAADINVPKIAWPVCDDFRTDFCVESITVQPLGTKTALKLVYSKSGAERPSAIPANPVTPANPGTPADPANTASPVAEPAPLAPVADRVAGNAVAGIWTHENWSVYGLDALGYDGLTVDIKTANQFTNNIFFTVYPGMFDSTNRTSIALKPGEAQLALDLDPDLKITVTTRIGAVKTGVSIGIANNLMKTTTMGTEENSGKMVVTGTPVEVPQVLRSSQCEGEAGVASAVTTTMQGFIVVETETSGFGVEGLSGRMAISSNGASCGISTPVWNETSETLTWEAGAPHFKPDGVTPNLGFYKAVIPANDALLLWGLTDPARVVSALEVTVISEAGGAARVAAKNISYLYGNIIIEATGFEYSKPRIQIKKIASYKGFAKKRDLTCTDPITKKRVVLKAAYGCPKAPAKPVQSFVSTTFAGNTTGLNATHQRDVRGYLTRFPEAN